MFVLSPSMEIIYKIDEFPNPGDRDVYRGIQEINKGNYQAAQKCFEKGSNYNNEYASLFNAIHYYTGYGFAKRDPSKSMNLFKKIALEWNNPLAQYLIGAMYLDGDKGISRHEKYALKWLSLAADNNWAAAMILLAGSYGAGKLLKQDDQKALSWFQKVAQRDDSETEPVDDGIIYLFGNKEFKLQLAPNIPDAIKLTIDHIIATPKIFMDHSKRSTAPELDNEADAVIWSIFTNRKSCGVVSSQISLGLMYEKGNTATCPDIQKSIYFLKQAAKNGNADACMSIAVNYDCGTNGVQDYKEALKWYKQALELDNELTESAFRIGVIYHSAEGIKNDCKLALHYFRLTVSHGDHGEAYLGMGDILEHGKDGVPQNYILARQYYEKAFDCGEVRAAVVLSVFYREGWGVRKDNKKAEEWMQKAIAASPKAKLELISPGVFRVIRPSG